MGEISSVNNYDSLSDASGSNSTGDSYSERTKYYRNLSLSYFSANPTEMITKHNNLKELCLEYGNPEAHYIEGIFQYFVKDNEHACLYHLRQSSNGNYREGTYLYGLLLLALERFHKGATFLDKLDWKEDLSTSDQCWKRVKKSLSDIPGIMNQGYYIAMVNLEALCGCFRNNKRDEMCNHGYYYQKLNQFVVFAMNKNN